MSGHLVNTSDLTAKQIAEKFGVSLRTARRHRQRETLPDVRRTVGMDGKTYPGSYSSYKRNHGTQADDDLRMSRSALRRFDRKTRYLDKDLEVLRDIQKDVVRILKELTSQVDEEE